MRTLIAACLLAGCSHYKKDKKPQPAQHFDIEALAAMHELYLSLESDAWDEFGFNKAHCDALQATALQVASGGKADLFQARDQDGRWWRTPKRDCLSSGRSKSTISGDMFLGLMVALWAKQDWDATNKIIEYGEEYGWVMGEHDGSIDGQRRAILSPGLIATLRDMRWVMEGSEKRDNTPQFWNKLDGFEAHLQALHIMLRGYIDGAVCLAY